VAKHEEVDRNDYLIEVVALVDKDNPIVGLPYAITGTTQFVRVDRNDKLVGPGCGGSTGCGKEVDVGACHRSEASLVDTLEALLGGAVVQEAWRFVGIEQVCGTKGVDTRKGAVVSLGSPDPLSVRGEGEALFVVVADS